MNMEKLQKHPKRPKRLYPTLWKIAVFNAFASFFSQILIGKWFETLFRFNVSNLSKKISHCSFFHSSPICLKSESRLENKAFPDASASLFILWFSLLSPTPIMMSSVLWLPLLWLKQMAPPEQRFGHGLERHVWDVSSMQKHWFLSILKNKMRLLELGRVEFF